MYGKIFLEPLNIISLLRSVESAIFLSDGTQARRRRRTTLHKQHGKRECERRLRRIASGSMRIENGLSKEAEDA